MITKIKTKAKKKVLIVFTAAVLLAANLMAARKLTSIEEPMKKPAVIVTENHLLLRGGFTFHVYSMKDFKYIKQFGKRGAGPGEFNILARPEIVAGKLTVTTAGKLVVFTSDGTFVEEFRSGKMLRDIYPVGNHFVAALADRESKTISVYDKKFNAVKTLYKGGLGGLIYFDGSTKKKDQMVVRDFTGHRVYDNKIYIADSSKGFMVMVYDSGGKQLNRIDKPYEKLKISQEYRDYQMAKKKENPRWELFKEMFNFVFPEYFPPFRDFLVREGKMYFITPFTLEHDRVVVTDLKGKTLATVTVPFGFYDKNMVYDIFGDHLYYLVENEDGETWDLYAESLK